MSSSILLRSHVFTSARTRAPRLVSFFSTQAPPDGPPVAPNSSYVRRQPPIPRFPDPKNPIRSGSNTRKMLETRIYRLHVHSTRNNTITTFTDEKGNPIAWFSGGSCGFKKVNRASYEAGYQCAVRIFARILEERKSTGPMMLEILFNGFGQGRDALQKALVSAEGEQLRPLVTTITDKSPLKIGGTRSKKARRL